MRKPLLYCILLIGCLVSFAPQTNASQGKLEYCQKLSDKIHYYTSLRKSGGSANTMEKWRQQLKKYKEKFGNRNCKKWRGQLDE